MKTHKNESAVSETIATILIVALTVIMAALIASYQFGMMNDVSQSRTIPVTTDQPDPTHIVVTYRSGPDPENIVEPDHPLAGRCLPSNRFPEGRGCLYGNECTI